MAPQMTKFQDAPCHKPEIKKTMVTMIVSLRVMRMLYTVREPRPENEFEEGVWHMQM